VNLEFKVYELIVVGKRADKELLKQHVKRSQHPWQENRGIQGI